MTFNPDEFYVTEDLLDPTRFEIVVQGCVRLHNNPDYWRVPKREVYYSDREYRHAKQRRAILDVAILTAGVSVGNHKITWVSRERAILAMEQMKAALAAQDKAITAYLEGKQNWPQWAHAALRAGWIPPDGWQP